MNILGIETSCDETAAAVVRDGQQILANIVASQADLHAQFGGVVPEVAARSHIEQLLPVISAALKQASCDWEQIDGIAVTTGPGLLGSLLIGNLAAQTLAELKQKPLYAVNHVEAHIYGAFLDQTPPRFPLLALIVSGGHTQLTLFLDHLDYQMLGQTKDDAAGEAFDKVAKLLGLPYPGGPALSRAAENGDPAAFPLPSAWLKPGYDFSFSGLKTAALRTAQQLIGGDYTTPSTGLAAQLTDQQVADLAASFEQAAVTSLAAATLAAARQYQPTSVVIAGGVAANQRLRQALPEASSAPVELCTDNAAMIAALGYQQALRGLKTAPDQLKPDSALRM